MKKVSRMPCTAVIKRLWDEFKYVYTNPYTLKWSVWYALFLCGYNQEGTYAQTLWQHFNNNGAPTHYLKYTGFVESAYTIIGEPLHSVLLSKFSIICFNLVFAYFPV